MTVYALGEMVPVLGPGVFVAPSASVMGDVVLGEDASVWFSTVIRGDVHAIRIGARTNIQDNSVVHVTDRKWPTTLGNDVTIGHSVVVHGCTIGDRSLIGIGSVLLDGAIIGEDCIVGAGSLITPGMVIKPGSVVMGRPARTVREVTEEDRAWILAISKSYVENASRMRRELRVVSE